MERNSKLLFRVGLTGGDVLLGIYGGGKEQEWRRWKSTEGARLLPVLCPFLIRVDMEDLIG